MSEACVVAAFYAPRYEKWAGIDYVDCLRLLQESCHRVGRPLVVITDTVLPDDLPQFVTDLPEELMQAIPEGIRKFREAGEGRVFVTGADCLLTRDPFQYAPDCDAAFTFGPFRDCPLNTGAMWLNTRASAALFADALARKPTQWGEDQTTLLAAVEASPLRIERLKCTEHNWAPTSPADQIDTTVVHFRGPRKSFMRQWWKNHQRQTPLFIVARS